MVQIVEEFVQLEAFLVSLHFRNDLEVAVEEALRKATKQVGDSQVIFSVAVERSGVIDHWIN